MNVTCSWKQNKDENSKNYPACENAININLLTLPSLLTAVITNITTLIFHGAKRTHICLAEKDDCWANNLFYAYLQVSVTFNYTIYTTFK